MEIPILEKKPDNLIRVEAPVLFQTNLVFVNGQGETNVMLFSCPPGLWPNPKYIVDLITATQQDALTALKLQTKDLTWRLPTPTEFVRITANNPTLHAEKEWSAPFSVELEEEVDDNSN